METIPVSKEFILQAHKAACGEWKSKIESELPELFKQKFEVGKWYKYVSPYEVTYIFRVSNISIDEIKYDNCIQGGSRYAFSINSDWHQKALPATPQEIENHLIKLAEKKGYKKGAKVRSLFMGTEGYLTGVIHQYNDDSLWMKTGTYTCLKIYEAGDWATIIEEKPVEYTLEEISELLKYKLNGRKLKIKNFVTCDSNELLSNI